MTHIVSRLGRVLMAVSCAGVMTPACLNRPIEPVEPNTTNTFTETLKQSKIDKVDILLAIDDSGSMADKQQILASAVPDLVEALVNPGCIDADGQMVATPDSPLDPCPGESFREFEPILDIHVGVISTSLGARGGSLPCSDDDATLISRKLDGSDLPTFGDNGFLVWRPEEPGGAGKYDQVDLLSDDLELMVSGVGESGCGVEAQLESWYRFLIDPVPYDGLEQTSEGGQQTPVGRNEQLLKQRSEFLRGDSMVAIVMLSDENDCSFKAEGQGYWTATKNDGGRIYDLKARSECASNPHDPCCAPCGSAPEQCPADPSCNDPVGAEERLVNLVCYDQQRRYGHDFLYPVQRYIDGLTKPQIADRDGNMVPNPLFVGDNGAHRDTDRVFLAGIVGVPWQLVARDAGDLSQGYQSASELRDNGTWNAILGDPANNVPPTDLHMVESIHPRAGLPGLGADPGSDPISSHEYEPRVSDGWGDLQYSCVFDLPEPIQCDANYGNCDCSPTKFDNNPLCQNPDGSYGNVQHRAKAYPSTRQLSVLEGIGDQAIVGSICPAQMSDNTKPDFGYQPAIEALIERLKSRLRGTCLQRSLTPDQSTGQVACVVLEGKKLDSGQSCGCDGAGRVPVPPEHQPAVISALQGDQARLSGLDCFCEIEQLSAGELTECQNSTELEPSFNGETLDGWCYIDAASFPTLGNEELVAHCRPTERRQIRFVGSGEPDNGASIFISCHE